MAEQIDSRIQEIIDTSERLIAEAQENSFERVCQSLNIEPARLCAYLAQFDSPEVHEKVAHALAEDRQEVEREIEAEAARRGLLRPAPRTRTRGLRI